jgi:hypothetical protein
MNATQQVRSYIAGASKEITVGLIRRQDPDQF